MIKLTPPLTPEEDALEHIVARRDKPFLEGRFIDSFKGRGLFTWETIEPSFFVVELRGNIFSRQGAPDRDGVDLLKNYLFEFSWKGANWCVDASNEDGSLGRLVNDDNIIPNCEIKKVVSEGKPHLCLFALNMISAGEEITINYGDSAYPWRSKDSPAFTSEESSFNGEALDEASYTQQDEKADSDSELDSDADEGPSKAIRKPKVPSYTSKNYCYVCGKGVKKMARHLAVHADEDEEIAKALALPLKSKERKVLLNNLRNRGNFNHNQEVLKNNTGELKLRRQMKTAPATFQVCVHCPYCKCLFVRREMWRHVARCNAKTTESTGKKKRVLSQIFLAESPFAEKLTSGVRELFSSMNADKISSTVQNDSLLVQLAHYLTERYENNPDKYEFIRQMLRQMGRLLLVLKKRSVPTFEDAIKPHNFYKVAEAVRDVAGFNAKVKCYRRPSLALKLGHSLKKIGAIVLSGASGNEKKMKNSKKFMKLCENEWKGLVSGSALASLRGRKINSPSTIPFTGDVQRFHKYLETASASALETLKTSESPRDYSALCRVTLAQVSILNKCSPEVAKMALKTFQEMDEVTQVLSKHFIRINVQSRSSQKVNILFTPELVSAITLLVNKREVCGVHKGNPFLFARPNSSATSLYHGRNCIRSFSVLCRAKKPEHLRSLKLHKHIARVFQILNLENDELDHLAKLLGRSIPTDRDYYRTPEAAVELAKIAKLILAMEKGSLEGFKGASLEEIKIEDELELDGEPADSDDSDENNEESDCLAQRSGMSCSKPLPLPPDCEMESTAQHRRQLTPEQDALKHIRTRTDKQHLEERFIDTCKGKGVFTRVAIEPSSFVVEYRGNTFPQKETRRKKTGDTVNKYLFDFSWDGRNWRIDASKEDGTLGRLVNDDHINPNCEIKKIFGAGRPHLCLFAVRKISPDEEITYNYGDSSYPWRSSETEEERSHSQGDPDSDASSQEDGKFEEYIPEVDDDSSDQQCQKIDPDVPESSRSRRGSSRIQQEDKSDGSSDDSISDEDDPDGSKNKDPEPQSEDTSYTKRNYCYVCGKPQSKISRHLFTHRNEEPDIARVFALPRTSIERKRELQVIRNKGNYKHNQEVLQSRSGPLKVIRRQQHLSPMAKNFAICLYCKGMYVRKDLWRHKQNCASKMMKTLRSCRNTVLSFVTVEEMTYSQDDVNGILKNMKRDQIGSVVKNDPHILLLAKCLDCKSIDLKPRKTAYISQRLREMGRLLLTLRKKSISTFEEAMKPQNFPKLAEAVRELSGFSEATKSCNTPSVMQKLGYSLRKMANINFAKAMREDADKQTLHDAEKFMQLCNKEWSNPLPPRSCVVRTSTMTFTRDAQLLHHCMEEILASAVESLTLYDVPQVYKALCKVTLAQVSVINKCNSDVSKLTLQAFEERKEAVLQDDATVCQPQLQHLLSKHCVTLSVIGISGKHLALMVTPELLGAITLLVNKRKACGVHEQNPFLFAKPDGKCASIFHDHQCVRTFTERCGAKDQTHFRSELFRKHSLRIFQILNLANDELGQLAEMLGCDICTDRQYYQSPEAVGDIAKIAALISAMEDGSMERFQGKSLKDIEIPDELLPDVAQDDPEGSDVEEDSVESESFFQLSGPSSPKDSFSPPSQPPPSRKRGRPRKIKCGTVSPELNDDKNDGANARETSGGGSQQPPSRKRGRPRKIECGMVSPELNDDKNDEVNTGKDGKSEEMHTSGAVDSDEGTPARSNKGASDNFCSDPPETSRGASLCPPSRKRGRPRKIKCGTVSPELKDDKNDGVNTRKDEKSEEMPTSGAVGSDEGTPACSNEDASYSFCDDDDDMNVDFDVDTDEDIDGNRANNEDDHTNSQGATPEEDEEREEGPPDKAAAEETMDSDAATHTARGEEDKDQMGVGSSLPTASWNTAMKMKLSPALLEMKELKILIPKLNIEKLQPPLRLSQLPSLSNSITAPEEDQSNPDQNKPGHEKATHMTCSHCRTSMLKGQTAYQRKGFSDVFCSKACLFGTFPIIKPVAKTCHSCLSVISQPLDLIMAAVDAQGTMKDFCCVACLSSFKAKAASAKTPQPLCSMCNKPCAGSRQVILNGGVLKFCSNVCMQGFCRDNMVVCESCCSYCPNKPLTLKLEDGAKNFCGEECLISYRETMQTHSCTMCHASQPVSNMVHFQSSEKTVELFCSRPCLASYKLKPAGCQGKEAVELWTTPKFTFAKQWAFCCHCGTKLQVGQEICQLKNSKEVFCSASCLSLEHPHIQAVHKNCSNCDQVITRPHNIILAPVDDSGTMRELCSETCLAFVKSRRDVAAVNRPPLQGPRTACTMCSKFSFCKYRLAVDNNPVRLCSDECFAKYHGDRNIPIATCDICSSVFMDKPLVLRMQDGRRNICSEECLVKFKQRVETSQLCPMCQTSHQMSDMVENKTADGEIDFFCSHQCMLVHESQSFPVPGRSSPSSCVDEEKRVARDSKEVMSDTKEMKNDEVMPSEEVKPSVPHLDFIKEEPVDEEYNQDFPSLRSTEDIKNESDGSQEDFKIIAVFSLSGNPAPAAPAPTPPTLTHMDALASCSHCTQVLVDGETIYQRKDHLDTFCSTSCLFKFYEMKPVKRSCLFCLRELTRTQEVIQDSSDSEGPVKIFCSQNCLSSFNYKSAINCKTSIKAATLQCNVCSRYCISKKEIIHGDTVYKVCSDSCFLHFCKLNKLSVCENCHSCCCAPLRLNMEEGCKALCSADCLSQFKQKTKTKQPCSMCGTLHPMSDMTENTNGTDVLELFCTSSCVMASQIQAISSSGTSLNCDNCGRNTVPACHIAMSDASIRNFCTLTCAMAFKATQKEKYVEANPAGAPEQTQCNIPKPPEKLQCAKCSRVIKTTPRVVQEKGKTDFVCSLACSQELNRLNKVMGKCEHCKNEAIIRETKRVNNKDCFFCSDGCKKLFGHELEKKWGRYCRSCAYCLSISKMVVTPESKTASEEFCSEGCRSKYKILCSDAAKCDNCGTKGKLNQQLPGLGHVKHFCDRKCLLQFCNKMKKGHFVNIGAAEASPVITNVISLASLLNRQKTFATSSSQHDSAPDIQTRVLGHVSTQTIPKELKNKSMLCTPLVHNKGVSCSVQTSNTMAQTDYIAPEVTVVRVPMPLPVPVPVYVPVPMNLYSQYTPSPLGLPLPLPVPMFLPATPDTPEVPVGTWKEGSPADSFSGELSSGSELEEKQDESEDVQQEKDETEVEKCRSESQPETPPAPPPPEMTERCQRTALTPPPSQQPVEKIHNKSKGIKQRTVAKSATRETAQRKTSKPASQKRLKLKSQYGIDAWRRWTEWRKSQTHLDFVSSHGAALKEDFLCCPAAELTDGLCSFIREVKRPGGEPYTPDTVFFLCLCIQQYLFENGRMENIFSDVIYSKFSSEFTKMLKGFRPSLTARGHIRSCVEEEFLWECKQLGAYSPIVLLNTLLFYCCKFFRFTTVEQHRQLTFANLKICHRTIQNVKTAFLSFYPRISMNEAEPDVDDVPAKMQRKSKRDEEIREMMENAENPLRCPVRLYEFYLSKCSDSVRRSSSVFYLEPNRSCAPFSCLWFCSTPLEDSTLEAMLVRILSIQELEEERRGE